MLLLDEPLSGVDGVSAARIEAVFAELQAEGRTLLVATHDVRQAAAWDRVLCLHGRQIDYGRPAAVLSARDAARDLRRRADRARGRGQRGRRRPPRARALMLGWLTDPFASPIVLRALAEVLILSLACGPLGVWVLLYRDAYAAESISHGMLPGLVVAALAGVPLLFGAVAGVLVAAAGIALVARDRRLDTDVGVAVVRLGAVRPRRHARALARVAAAAAGAAVRRPARRHRRRPRGRRRARRRRSRWRWPPATGRSRWSRSTAARRRRSARARRAGSWRVLVVLAVTTVAAVQGLGNLLLVALVLAPAIAALQPRPAAGRGARAVGRAGRAGRHRRAAALVPPRDRRRRVGRAVRGRRSPGSRCSRRRAGRAGRLTH